MANSTAPNALFIEFFLKHLENFKGSEAEFKAEFEEIIGQHSVFKKMFSSYTNWKLWFNNLGKIEKEINNINDSKFKTDFDNIVILLKENISNYLIKNFENPHIKINDQTLKEYFKAVIIPEIINNPNNNSQVDDINEQWKWYLKDFKNSNTFVDELILHALGNVLGEDLTCLNSEGKEIKTNNCGKINLLLEVGIDNHKFLHKFLIKETRKPLSFEEIKEMKKNKKNQVIEIDIDPLNHSPELEIVKYLMASTNSENDKKVNNALAQGKTLILLIKTKQPINQKKLQDLLAKNLNEKHNGKDNKDNNKSTTVVKATDLSKSSRLESSSIIDNKKYYQINTPIFNPEIPKENPIEISQSKLLDSKYEEDKKLADDDQQEYSSPSNSSSEEPNIEQPAFDQ